MADRVLLGKVKLRKPVEAHGVELKVLEFRDPTAKDLMSVPMPSEERTIEGCMVLAASLANVPPGVIEGLPRKEALEVMALVNPIYLELLGTFAP